jgi:hypothetical protein
MTGGQVDLGLAMEPVGEMVHAPLEGRPASQLPLKVIRASEKELDLHRQRLREIEEAGGKCLWLELEEQKAG